MGKDKVMKAIVQVCGSVDPSLGKMVSNTDKSLGKINTKAAIVSAAVVAGFGAATKELYDFGKAAVENASTFQSEMQNVATLLDGTEEQVHKRVSKMQQEIISVSNETGVATSELSDGMYQVVSAFGDSADSINILETAAKSASAGGATTTDAINLLSAVTKAYGDTSNDAVNKVSDLAFETVKLGQTTFPELAQNMGKVTSMSNTLGVSQEELFGVFATGTGVVGGAAEVSTQLKAIYTKLQKPTKEMSKAMQSMGYETAQAMIESEGLQGTLDSISDYAKKKGTNLSVLYGSSNAANLATALTGDLSDGLTRKTQAMAEAAGMTDTAFGRQEQSIEKVEEKIKNLGENFKTQVGLAILPMVQNLAEDALPMIASAIEVLTPILESLLGDTLKQLTPLLEYMFPQILDMLVEFTPIIGDLLTTILPPLFAILKAAMPIITWFAHFIADSLSGAIQNLTPLFNNVIAIIKGLINFIVNIFSGKWEIAWQNIVSVFANIFSGIGNLVKAPINSVLSIINNAIDSINKISFGKKTVNIPKIPLLAKGGFTNGPSIAGEVPGQTEAVISFLPSVRDENIAIWKKAGEMLGVNPYQQHTPLQLAGELINLDGFSLGDMGATTIIYYDFSGFEYHPEIHNNNGENNNEDKNIIDELEEHKYEFADWFEQWMSLVTQED